MVACEPALANDAEEPGEARRAQDAGQPTAMCVQKSQISS